MVRMAQWARRATPDPPDLPGPPDRRVRRDLPVRRDRLDPLDPLDLPVRRDRLDPSDPLALLDRLATPWRSKRFNLERIRASKAAYGSTS
jgi:hypothetical protein